ncbi:MAG: L,D-transpeptidase family protein [Anaerolineaceae bacterium]|jgi:lipoprotein-anchoring transpeptidase ErfK/SrfK
MSVKIIRMIVLTVFLLLYPLSAVQAAAMADDVCGDFYIVRRGDNLRKIARMCETTVDNLLVLNPDITNINRIYVGQRIDLLQPEANQPTVILEPASGITGSVTQVQVRNFPPKAAIILAIGEAQDNLFEFESIQTDEHGSFNLDMLVIGEPGRDWLIRARLVDDPGVVVTSEKFLILEQAPITEVAPVTEAEPVTEETPDESFTYIVRRGDSLSKIARMFNRTTSHLLVANPNIANPNRIYPGQVILIPGEVEQAHRTAEARSALSAEAIATGARWIEVDIAHQTVRAWEGDELVRSFLVSTGRPRTPTVRGQFHIWVKLLYDDMRGPGYDLRDVPYVMYFHKGYGLHGTYWHNDFGTPRSAGCVNLRTEDARWLYHFAEVGTLVEVH